MKLLNRRPVDVGGSLLGSVPQRKRPSGWRFLLPVAAVCGLVFVAFVVVDPFIPSAAWPHDGEELHYMENGEVVVGNTERVRAAGWAAERAHQHASRLNIDAVVFFATGRYAGSPLVAQAVKSLRIYGRWTGDVVLITDRPQCVGDWAEDMGLLVIAIPEAREFLQWKTIKCRLFDIIPERMQRILFSDVDILFTKDLQGFLSSVAPMVNEQPYPNVGSQDADSGGSSDDSDSDSDLEGPGWDVLMFPDRWRWGPLGYFHSHWQLWNSGVYIADRWHSQDCLSQWCAAIDPRVSRQDQVPLQRMSREGMCRVRGFPNRDMVFMNDPFGLLLQPLATFAHFESSFRDGGPWKALAGKIWLRWRAGVKASRLYEAPLLMEECRE